MLKVASTSSARDSQRISAYKGTKDYKERTFQKATSSSSAVKAPRAATSTVNNNTSVDKVSVVKDSGHSASRPSPSTLCAPPSGRSAWSENLLQKLKHQEETEKVERLLAEPETVDEPVNRTESFGAYDSLEAALASLDEPHDEAVFDAPYPSPPVAEEDEDEEDEEVEVSDDIQSEIPVSVQLDDSPLPEPSMIDISVPPLAAYDDQPPAKEPQAFETEETKKFLNLGKWDISDVLGGASLSFGSFGMDEPDALGGAPWKEDDVITSGQQQQQHAMWSTPPSAALSPAAASPALSALFPSEPKLSSPSTTDTATTVESAHNAKAAIPPGLDSKQAVGQGQRPLSNQPTPTRKAEQPYPMAGAQYSAPPGIAAGRPPSLVPAPSAIPPFPYQGFELNPSAQYVNPYGTAAASVSSAGSVAQSSGAANSSNSTANNQSVQAQSSQQQQQQQQFAPPPGISGYGYYPAPYFANQAYYYNQPVGNYYSQGRNPYQNARAPYPADPYGNPGSVYQDLYAGGGQFPDSNANYGVMPIHPSLSSAAQTALPSVGNGAVANGNKPKQTAAQPSAQQFPVDSANPYAYNPYTGRTSEQQQQQPQWPYPAQAWGMPQFPSPSLAPQQQQAYTQPQQQQQQGGSGRDAARPTSAAGSFNGGGGSFSGQSRGGQSGATGW